MLNEAALQQHTLAHPPNPYQTVKRYLAALEPPSPGDLPSALLSSPGTSKSSSSKHSRIMRMKSKDGSLASDAVKKEFTKPVKKAVKEFKEQPASPLLVSRVQKQASAQSVSPEGKSKSEKRAESSRKRKAEDTKANRQDQQRLSAVDSTRQRNGKAIQGEALENTQGDKTSRKRKEQPEYDSEGDPEHVQRLEARKLRRRERAAIKQPEKRKPDVADDEKSKKKRKTSAAEDLVARATGGPSRKTLNVSKDRITVRCSLDSPSGNSSRVGGQIKDQPRLGLFSKGASSAQMTKQSVGVPDLAFREYSFLSRKPSTRTAVFAPVAESDLKSKYRRQASEDETDDAHSAASLAQRKKKEVVKEHAPKAISSKPVTRKRQKSANVSSDVPAPHVDDPDESRLVSPNRSAHSQPTKRRSVPPAQSADVSLNDLHAPADDVPPRVKSRSAGVSSRSDLFAHTSARPPEAVPQFADMPKEPEADRETSAVDQQAVLSLRPQSAPASNHLDIPPPSFIQSRPHSADHQRISSNESIPLDQINMTGWSRYHSSDEQVPMDWLHAPESNGGEVLFNQPVQYTEEWLNDVESLLSDEYYVDEGEEDQYEEQQYAGEREAHVEVCEHGQEYAEVEGQAMDEDVPYQDAAEEQDEMQHFWWRPRRRGGL